MLIIRFCFGRKRKVCMVKRNIDVLKKLRNVESFSYEDWRFHSKFSFQLKTILFAKLHFFFGRFGNCLEWQTVQCLFTLLNHNTQNYVLSRKKGKRIKKKPTQQKLILPSTWLHRAENPHFLDLETGVGHKIILPFHGSNRNKT